MLLSGSHPTSYSYTVPKDGATHSGLCPSTSMSNEDNIHKDEPIGQSNTVNSSNEVSYSRAVDNEDWPPQGAAVDRIDNEDWPRQGGASDRRSKVH